MFVNPLTLTEWKEKKHPSEFAVYTERTSSSYPSGVFRVKINSTFFGIPCTQVTDLIVKFRNFFSDKEYEIYSSLPLKTNDPTLLTMNSTVAMFKEEIMEDVLLGKRAMSQLCFRAKECNDYLYAFNMVGISADIAFLDEVYINIIEFLKLCEIRFESLHIVLNPEDTQLAVSTAKIFPSHRIHHLSDNNDKYDVRWNFGGPCLKGKGLTIVGKIRYKESNENENITSSNFVALGNIILVDNGGGERYIDVGIGVECLLSYFNSGKIFSIPFYHNQIEKIKEIQNLYPVAQDLLKNLLAFFSLYSEEIFPGNKLENYIATKIQNKIFYLFYKTKQDSSVFELIKNKISIFYSSEEMKILSQAFSLLNSNFKKYINNISNNNSKARNLCSRLFRKNLNEKEIQHQLWSTFGLPKKLIKEVIMDNVLSSSRLPHINLNEVSTQWAQADLSNVQNVHFKQGIIACNQIALRFLSFFVHQPQPKEHLIIKGSSVLTKNDPTLLFINSGMAAIKPYFTGEALPPAPNLCNIQPCIRTNDIDDIGDMHHLSFFHMMGSWSIGDYYKKEAVELAYDLLINVLKFPKEKLYVTVFGGEQKLNIEPDNETAAHWRLMGFDDDHIVFLPAEDNFWGPAGDTGPCGPCTEIFYDMGDGFASPYVPGRGETFNTKDRYVEIWNAGVFMQYFMHSDKTLTPLNLKSVDTGSGLERMSMTMNGYSSVYETDLIKPIFDTVEQVFPNLDIYKKRMLTDHIRTAIYLVSEGVYPGNTGREYIVRKLIRKCIAVISKTNSKLSTLDQLLETSILFLSKFYPHFKGNEEAVKKIIISEAEETLKVIREGIKLVEKSKPISGNVFSAKTAHFLVTTKGLPFDILQQTLQDSGLQLDLSEYMKLDEKHKLASRFSEKNVHMLSVNQDIQNILNTLQPTKFEGYDKENIDSSDISILVQNQLVVDEIANDQHFYFAVPVTTFYAECGGQCGDKGFAYTDNCEIEVIDTKVVEGIYLHEAKLTSGILRSNEKISLRVDPEHRAGVKRNHSATHLLHYALCHIIGSQALQQGSLVEPSRLRFDFKLPNSLSEKQIEQIEESVNMLIRENHAINVIESSFEQAKSSGAVAMFGEKYKERVRVVEMGPSRELCGGTHASRTGDLGLFLIQSEKSIAKGIRRIIALTGPEALKTVWARNKLLKQVASTLDSSVENVLKRAELLKGQASIKNNEEKKFIFSELGRIELKGNRQFHILTSSEIPDRKAIAGDVFDKNPLCAGCFVFIQSSKGLNIRCINKDQGIDAGKIILQLINNFEGKGGGSEQQAQCTVGASIDEVLLFLSQEFLVTRNQPLKL